MHQIYFPPKRSPRPRRRSLYDVFPEPETAGVWERVTPPIPHPTRRLRRLNLGATTPRPSAPDIDDESTPLS